MGTLIEYWEEIGSVVGGIILFFSGRKSAKILERKSNAEAITAMQSTYDTFLSHYKEQYDTLLAKNKDLSDKLEKNTERLNNIELRNAILSESSKVWEDKYRALEKDHNNLKRAFEEYKLKTENSLK